MGKLKIDNELYSFLRWKIIESLTPDKNSSINHEFLFYFGVHKSTTPYIEDSKRVLYKERYKNFVTSVCAKEKETGNNWYNRRVFAWWNYTNKELVFTEASNCSNTTSDVN